MGTRRAEGIDAVSVTCRRALVLGVKLCRLEAGDAGPQPQAAR